ncbi:hypothetical protein IF128_09595 [Empedobacter stercoris]|uniref:Outer membrane protein assembly factor BamE n=1 Tax=Empedobacter stercoris TaxID=1628248 RepID=A0ABX1WNY4_9FLAO|nr:hypothetical protein [Empedobacter stercoris]MCA4809993.1 hypothetical protein [Empedobacter stercoris]NOJ76255.1 hypothetical protein [Empedobacter stercoris]QNT13344.1 hypothetical protein HNV03_00845 [Empedobacter stercoris]
MRIKNYILLALSAVLFSCGKFSHEKFDSNKWKTENLNSENNWNLRWSMMNDLRNNYQIKGLTQKEIIELLGTPENIINNQFRYFLGYSGKGINTGILVLTFDENNKVLNFIVTEG